MQFGGSFFGDEFLDGWVLHFKTPQHGRKPWLRNLVNGVFLASINVGFTNNIWEHDEISG